jgi:transposase
MPKTIDPYVLAQFMTQPGAAELVEAFSSIPPGPLRESLVHHAQVTAMTYLGGPINMTPPPRIGETPPRAALPSPRRSQVATEDPAVKAVEMILQGVSPHEIANALQIPIRAVYAAKREARASGVKLPAAPKGKKPRVKGRPSIAYHTSLDTLPHQGMSRVAKAAEERGITPEGYMARRKLALEMALDGRHIRAIVEATKEPKIVLQQWFYQAREAGHDVPYIVDTSAIKVEEVAPPELPANVIDLQPHRKANDAHKGRFILFETEMDGSNGGGIIKGAQMMDVDVPEYLRRRREAVELFRREYTPAIVAKRIGVTLKQAENWRGRAQRAGILSLTKAGAERRAKQQAGERRVDTAPATAGSIAIAAKALGLTAEAYNAKRDRALTLFEQGLTGTEVAAAVGVPLKKAQNWRTWSQAGRAERTKA